MTRRGPLPFLLLVGIGVLIGSALAGGSVGFLAAPFVVAGVIFKVFFFFLLFGFIFRAFGGRRGWQQKGQWCADGTQDLRDSIKRHHADDPSAHTSGDERFEDWHRLAHAREEVDEHVPPFLD